MWFEQIQKICVIHKDILRQQQQHTQLISHRSNANFDRNGNGNETQRNGKECDGSYRPTRSVGGPQTAKKFIKVFNGVYYQYL